MSASVVEKLKSYQIPEIFSRERMNELYAQVLLGEAQLPLPSLDELIDVLRSPDFTELMKSGKVTVAMIKPGLKEYMNVDQAEIELNEDQLQKLLQDNIQPPLEPIFSLSFVMTPEMADTFYSGGPKERQLQVAPDQEVRGGKKYENRWEEFKDMMTSGSVTFFILLSEDAKAIENWREQMGNHWNIERVKELYPNSLRARFAKDKHNNLLHGSDSVESVQREVGLLTKFVEELTKQEKKDE